jgi:hypothetical protein
MLDFTQTEMLLDPIKPYANAVPIKCNDHGFHVMTHSPDGLREAFDAIRVAPELFTHNLDIATQADDAGSKCRDIRAHSRNLAAHGLKLRKHELV